MDVCGRNGVGEEGTECREWVGQPLFLQSIVSFYGCCCGCGCHCVGLSVWVGRCECVWVCVGVWA